MDCLFWIFNINRIIYHVDLYNWFLLCSKMFSNSIHVIACILFYCWIKLPYMDILHFVYILIKWWVFRLFITLVIMNYIVMIIHIQAFMWTYTFIYFFFAFIGFQINFCMWISSYCSPLVEKTILSHSVFAKTQLTINITIDFWTFNSIPLMYSSHKFWLLWLCSIAWNWKVWKLQLCKSF